MRGRILLIALLAPVALVRADAPAPNDARGLAALRALYGAAPTRLNAGSFREALVAVAHRLPAEDAPLVTKHALTWLAGVFEAEPDFTRHGKHCDHSNVPTCFTLRAAYDAAEQAYLTLASSVNRRGVLEPFHAFARRLHHVKVAPCEAHLSDAQQAVRALVLGKYLFDRVSGPVGVGDPRCLRVTTLGGAVEFVERDGGQSRRVIDDPVPDAEGERATSDPPWPGVPAVVINEHGGSWGNEHVLKRVLGEWRFVATRGTSIACDRGAGSTW